MTFPTGPNVRQFARYAVVGVTQNGANIALFALVVTLGVPLVPGALIAAAGALALSFALNHRWTFPGAEDRAAGRAARYAIVWIGFIVTAIPTLVLLVKMFGVPRIAAQAMIIAVGAPISYLIQRNWTFRPTPPVADAEAIVVAPAGDFDAAVDLGHAGDYGPVGATGRGPRS